VIHTFGSQWFKKYQKPLRFYANTIGRDRLQLPTDRQIIAISPHSVTWQEDRHGLKSTAFYPRSPITDALKMDLWPFWKALHSLDMSFLARKLSLNFGFDTLTRYPDPNPETDTVDGNVTRYVGAGETIAVIRAGTGNGSGDTAVGGYLQLCAHATTADKYTYLQRIIALFNTSALTAGASISAATYGFVKFGSTSVALGDTYFCLLTSDPASNTVLASGDFQRTWGTTDLFATPFALSTIGDGRITKNISADGLALISKTGITKLGHKLGWDVTGDATGLTWGGGKHTTASIYLADQGTPATYAPCLIVTYSTAQALTATLTESIAGSDVLLNQPSVFFIENNPLSDVVTKQTVKPLPEAITTNDVLTKQINKVLSDNAVMDDIITKVLAKLLAESLTVASLLYPGQNYYVDATLGLDSNDGKSVGAPWKTIAKVNAATFLPNDQILFKRGETWKEILTPITSGTAGAPIVFGSYGTSALPIIDAEDTRWGCIGKLTAANLSYLTFQELDLRNANYYGMYWLNVDHFIVQDCVATNAGGHGIEFYNNSSYITIQHNTVSGCNGRVSGGGEGILAVANFTYSRIHGNVVHNCVVGGIQVGWSVPENDNCNYNEIDGNECYANGHGLYTHRADHCLIYNNYLHHNVYGDNYSTWTNESSNLWYAICTLARAHCRFTISGLDYEANELGSKGAVDSTGDYWLDTANDRLYIYYATADAGVVAANVRFGVYCEPYGFCNESGANNEIYDNEISYNDIDGIELWSGGGERFPYDYACSYNKIYRNKIHHNSRMGITFTDSWPPTSDPLVNNEIYYNLIYDNGGADNAFGGFCVPATTGSGNKLYNNTIAGNNIENAGIYIGNVAGWDIKNNIIANNGTDIWNTAELQYLGNTITHDHNLYYRSGGWAIAFNGSYYSLANVENIEATAQVTDPQFIDVVTFNFHIPHGSPCENAGVDVGLTSDYDGKTIVGNPDIGAYEASYWTKTATETFVSSDSIVKSVAKPLIDSASISSVLMNLAGKTFTDSASMSDLLLRLSGKALTDSAGISDLLLRLTGKGLIESLSENDNLLKTSNKGLGEGIVLLDDFYQYPPEQSDVYVKATTKDSTNFWPYFATDPAKSLTGSWNGNAWVSALYSNINQRFHIDLGSAKIIGCIYYENLHYSGGDTDTGVRHFTVWGSNSATAFAELTYGIDTDWIQITAAPSEFEQHIAANQADPKYIDLTNTTAYRYIALKFSDNWGDSQYMGLRRIVLMTGYGLLKLVGKNLIESMNLSDSLTNLGVYIKILSESLNLSEGTMVKVVSKALADSLSSLDSFSTYGSLSQLLSEGVSISDLLNQEFRKSLAENLPLSDTVAKLIGMKAFETVTNGDSLVKAVEKWMGESSGLSDNLSKIVGKKIIESVTPTEIVYWQVIKSLSEIITNSDVLLFLTGKKLDESMTILDVYQNEAKKVLAEPVEITDDLTKTIQKLFADIVTASDQLIRESQYIRTFLEGVTENDALIKNIGKVLSGEFVDTSDILVFGISANLQESLVLSDALLKLTAKQLPESISESDSIGIQKTISQSLAENMMLTDAFGIIFQKMIAEHISLIDSFGMLLPGIYSESLSVSDDLSKQIGKTLAAELISITQSDFTLETTRILSESMLTSDTITKLISKILADSTIINDSLTLVYYRITKLYLEVLAKRYHTQFEKRFSWNIKERDDV
jgi:parallel beta-helix repeat protein